MNIYDFFNSRDVADHCKKINHKFTATEMAYIVYNSNHHTLIEKHNSWQQIINTMPDEMIPENHWVNDSLHNFLDSLIKLQNRFVQEFIVNKGNYVYTVSNLNEYSGHRFKDDWFFNDYRACLDSVKNTISKNYYEVIKISRHNLQLLPVPTLCEDTTDGCDAMVLNEKLDVLSIEAVDCYCEPNDKWFYLNPSFLFEDMPIAIPTPFRKGDIVTDVSKPMLCRYQELPLVVESYPLLPKGTELQNGLERSQRTVKGWFLADDGDILWKYEKDYLNLVYHDLDDRQQFLQNVSAYLQEEISKEVLMQRHREFLQMKWENAMLSELIHKEEQERMKPATKVVI